MSVYFVTCRELGLVKIGHAASPARRLQGFKTGSPAEITLEATIEGGGAEERELHRRFAEHRQRGEWFRLCPEIEALIEQHRPAPAPVKDDRIDFEQGELIGPFRFDPMGWLEAHGATTPKEEYPRGVSDWLSRQADKIKSDRASPLLRSSPAQTRLAAAVCATLSMIET